MAFSYFDTGKRSPLKKVGLQVTGLISQLFPRLSNYIGYKLLLNTHAPKRTQFTELKASQQFVLDSRAGHFTVHVFGLGNKVALVSHGWGETSSSFEKLISSLLDQGFKVVAIDHVGHGQSQGTQSHLLSFIESLELTIAHFEKQGDSVDTLIGHSMGGMAILNLPETTLQNAKIILISVPVQFFTIMFETVERFGISRKLVKGLLETITPKYGKTWLELQSENQLFKLHDQILFIHDENDRLAPIGDTVEYVSKAPATLIKTQGLGHKRILSDTGVIEQIRAKLAAV